MNVWELNNEISKLKAQQADYMNLRKELIKYKKNVMKAIIKYKIEPNSNDGNTN